MLKKSILLRSALAATSLCAALVLTGCRLPFQGVPAPTTEAATLAAETTEVTETTETVTQE